MSSQDNSYSSANGEIVRSLDAINKRLYWISTELQEIEDYHPDERGDVLAELMPSLLAAIHAVLELHKPITDDGNSLRNWLGMGNGKPRDYCNECEVDGYTAVPYPCPTVTAIHQALGEGEK